MTDPYILPDGNVQIAFSGGRTSAYMLHQSSYTVEGPVETVWFTRRNPGDNHE